jgi:hypothetical protein
MYILYVSKYRQGDRTPIESPEYLIVKYVKCDAFLNDYAL